MTPSIVLSLSVSYSVITASNCTAVIAMVRPLRSSLSLLTSKSVIVSSPWLSANRKVSLPPAPVSVSLPTPPYRNSSSVVPSMVSWPKSNNVTVHKHDAQYGLPRGPIR